jgi:hypothetical protein
MKKLFINSGSWSLVLILFVAFPRVASPGTIVPVNIQMAILIKALSYDRRLSRSTGDIVIGVVKDSSRDNCTQTETGIMKSVKKMHRLTAHGRNFAVIAIDTSQLGETPVDVLYLTRCVASQAPEITTFSRKNKILTVTAVPSLMTANVGMGIFPSTDDHSTNQIVINLKQVRAEGAVFDSRFLRLTKILQTP